MAQLRRLLGSRGFVPVLLSLRKIRKHWFGDVELGCFVFQLGYDPCFDIGTRYIFRAVPMCRNSPVNGQHTPPVFANRLEASIYKTQSEFGSSARDSDR